MKPRDILLTLVVSSALAGLTTNAVASEDEEHEQDSAKLEAQAKISQAEAEKTALGKVPGSKVKETELEMEKGLLVWCIDVAGPGADDETEVLVNAKTGAVVAVEQEAPKDEMKEKKGKKKEKGEGSEDEEGEEGKDRD
jgi:uncharacterized membrane protein YkoI